MMRLIPTTLVALAVVVAALASTASAQDRGPHPSLYRDDDRPYRYRQARIRMSPEEIARHDAQMAVLEARCDQIGEEACLEELTQQRSRELRGVTQTNIALVLGALAVAGGLVWWRRRGSARSSLPAAMRASSSGEQWDLAVLELALPREHVGPVRRELDALLAGRADPREALAPVAAMLAAVPWTHVSLRQWARSDASVTTERHRAVRSELAGRATLEVPPDPGRGYRGEAGPRDQEHALVSLVVLSHVDLPDQLGTPVEAARCTLSSLQTRAPSDLVSFELVWFPPGPGETTHTRDLLARAPRLVPTSS